jgi:hypothetical protein
VTVEQPVGRVGEDVVRAELPGQGFKQRHQLTAISPSAFS